jgi:glycosyltransferase involved in cell wall biosynthesis
MRIGIDTTCWLNRRGYGRHARALIRELVRLDRTNEYILFLDSRTSADLPARAEVRFVPSATPAALAASASGHRSFADMWNMSRALSSEALDLLLFPTIYSYVPVFTRAKKIVMIHDVIAETYPQFTLSRTTARLFWHAKVTLGRWQADVVVTVSEYSRRRIVEHFRTPPQSVFVVGEAADPIFRRVERPQASERLKALGVDGSHRIICYVGGFSPYKNLDMLVSAFAEIASQERFSDVLLVMVGEYRNEVFHSCFNTIAAQVERLGLKNRVVFTGYLPDEELVQVLNLATLMTLPSMMEGFGLPAVEAAACGCPVIATTASPLPELLGGGAICIDPSSATLREAIESVLDSAELQERMRTAGTRAAALTWQSSAKQLIGIIQTVGCRSM